VVAPRSGRERYDHLAGLRLSAADPCMLRVKFPMTRRDKVDPARLRVALAKGQVLAGRAKELENCLSMDEQVALSAALADDYAALFEEYPDVFPAPPKSPVEVREGAKALLVAHSAAEEEKAEELARTTWGAKAIKGARPRKPS
jgi:hypothetical protein